jgi:putative ABC transport system permease protein
VAATAYYIDPGEYRLLSIGLRKEGLAATLAAIDRLWDETSGTGRPISRSFIDDYLNQLYAQVRVQSELLAVLTGIAICIGCAGISGLAAFAAQRRTREIGVRKALGASNGDIVRLLAWQFVKPVLLANLIAWPVAELVLSRWLEGFAYHTSVSYLWLAACSVLSVGIAFAVVSIRVCLSARAKPVQALRYE